MDTSCLEVHDFEGRGYQPLIDFGGWRVAMLRYLDELQPDRITSMERHTATDEVFVLLHGRGMLLVGGNGLAVDGIDSQRMEPGRLYNLKRLAWHSILLSRDASVLLVENRDTGDHNSEYAQLSPSCRRQILDLAKSEGFE